MIFTPAAIADSLPCWEPPAAELVILSALDGRTSGFGLDGRVDEPKSKPDCSVVGVPLT